MVSGIEHDLTACENGRPATNSPAEQFTSFMRAAVKRSQRAQLRDVIEKC